ncbi:2-hydroxyacid dehydrogenase [Rivibacter subsaxonicus]|uniref:Glyoxylate/hydroxypyruvate reductase A n=1 Tax=Rivibacter subsaxonicus TaxID=457575 RepID=A0A4Q7VVH6_9BURK|nr:glyoxylate/hydroxypyruvate reductase A [Rivibacter subsaxonicus]RZU00667.1 glyoxylate/hydroxypyruvate reductase A [Rivibacter subsaxonicus]
MTILLACDFDAREWASWRPALDAALPGERFVTDADEGPREAIDIAIVANPAPGALAGLPKLRLVQSLWAGVDRLLADPTLPAEVPLARMVDPLMNAAMAETALWAVLGLHRGFFRYQRLQQQARWAPHGQTRADETTVAVLGLGQMGATCARRIAGHGYRVTGWSARARAIDGIDTRAGWDALPSVLGAAQIVVNLLPLTDATRDLFDAARLGQMQAGASLVNLARGAHVVEAELLAALDGGHLRHAVLDVFRSEPLPAEHPFWGHPRITVLPHAAAQTDPRSASAVAALNVRALRDGASLAHQVDRQRGY